MDLLKVFLFLFLSFPLYHAANDCPYSVCANNGFPIRFPFRLPALQPKNCGYPGFTLRCNNQGMSVLNLPYSGDFLIRNINYREQVVQLYDPYKCLPKRLLELNLRGLLFKAIYHQNYTFLSCPPDSTRSRFSTIDCLSNSTSITLVTTSMGLATSLTECKIIFTLRIPVSRPVQFDGSFSSDLNKDLQLTWTIPNCDDCEKNGGLCAFKNSTSQTTVCSYNTYTGTNGVSVSGTKNASVLKIIALCVALPTIATSFVLAILTCLMDRRRNPNNRQNNFTPEATTPEVEIGTPGLDETTIESYAKVIVGESQILPGPNNITCPICLSDYHAKDTLRCIPECQHCFHSDCIDVWLRLKGTCPVCRIHPHLVI